MTSQTTIPTLIDILALSTIDPNPILVKNADNLFLVWNRIIFDYASGATLLSRLGFSCPNTPEIGRVIYLNRSWNTDAVPEGIEDGEWLRNINQIDESWAGKQKTRLKEVDAITKWGWVDPKNALVINM